MLSPRTRTVFLLQTPGSWLSFLKLSFGGLVSLLPVASVVEEAEPLGAEETDFET